MYIGLHTKYHLFFTDFNETRIFSTEFLKKIFKKNFMKIRPVGAELFQQTGGRTDRHDECNSRFRNFSDAPKN